MVTILGHIQGHRLREGHLPSLTRLREEVAPWPLEEGLVNPVPSRHGPSSSSPCQTGEAQRLPHCVTRGIWDVEAGLSVTCCWACHCGDPWDVPTSTSWPLGTVWVGPPQPICTGVGSHVGLLGGGVWASVCSFIKHTLGPPHFGGPGHPDTREMLEARVLSLLWPCARSRGRPWHQGREGPASFQPQAWGSQPCTIHTCGKLDHSLQEINQQKKNHVWSRHQELAPRLVGAFACHPLTENLACRALHQDTFAYCHSVLFLRGSWNPLDTPREAGWLGLGLPALVPSPGSWAHTRLGLRALPAPKLPGRLAKGKQQEAMVLGGLAWSMGGLQQGAPWGRGMGPGRPSLFWAGLPISGMHALPFLGASFPNNQQYLSGTNEGVLAFHVGGEMHLLQQLQHSCLGCCCCWGAGSPCDKGQRWRKGSVHPVKALG